MRQMLPLFIACFVAAIVQISIFPYLNLAAYLSLPLVVVIYTTVFIRHPWARWCAPFVGLVLDIFSPLPFGTHLLGLSVVVVGTEALFLQLFTNRSILAMLALAVAASAAYQGMAFASDWLYSFVRATTVTPLDAPAFFWHLLGSAAAMFVLFYTVLGLQTVAGRLFLRPMTRM